MNKMEFAGKSWEKGTEFKLCDGCSLDGDDLEMVREALKGTPFEGDIKEITSLSPKIDEDGYFGADFQIVDKAGEVWPAEVFVQSVGVVMFFRAP